MSGAVRWKARGRNLSLECCSFHQLQKGRYRPRPLHPIVKEQRGTDTCDLEFKMHGLTIAIQIEDHLAGTGRKKRAKFEVGMAEIKRERGLPPGWE